MNRCEWCGDIKESAFDDYCSRECTIAHNEAELSTSEVNQSVNSDIWFIGIVLLIIAFHGKPDLVDALIYFLMK